MISIELKVTCVTCPLAFEGTVAGMEVAYRARHNRWGVDLPAGVEATGEETGGSCSTDDEGSFGFAMSKLFGIEAVQHAIFEEDMRQVEEQFRAVGW